MGKLHRCKLGILADDADIFLAIDAYEGMDLAITGDKGHACSSVLMSLGLRRMLAYYVVCRWLTWKEDGHND